MSNNTPWICNQDYTAVPHSVLECLYMQTELPASAIRVLCYLMRMTWGYRRKSDFISSRQIARDMKIKESAVSRALKTLTRYGIINRRHRHITIEQKWQNWLLPSLLIIGSKLTNTLTLDTKLTTTATIEANAQISAADKKLTKTATKVNENESKVNSVVNATPLESIPLESIPIESYSSQKINLNKIPGLPPGITDEYAVDTHGQSPWHLKISSFA